MKKIHILVFLALILGMITLSFIGCDLAGVTIDARIDSFIFDINSDRNNLKMRFSS
jgi:ABC-type transport system involved in cytochrome c biogenesis permease component